MLQSPTRLCQKDYGEIGLGAVDPLLIFVNGPRAHPWCCVTTPPTSVDLEVVSIARALRLRYQVVECEMRIEAIAEIEEFEPQQPSLAPDYLRENYWWAYIHPSGVRVFERQWLVNLILWGNFAPLRDAALDELGRTINGRTLQVACVYGDFSTRLAERIPPGSSLHVVDVLAIQLQNLRDKLAASAPVTLYQRDSTRLGFGDAIYDQAVIFFLLHEQPEKVRRQTLAEALRVVRPGGKLVIVDYHLPGKLHVLRYLLRPVLRALEPYALDLWHCDVAEWLPKGVQLKGIGKQTFCGGLYQKLVIIV